MLQLYWNGRSPLETVSEYMAYEFSPDAADALAEVASEMEQSLDHRCRLPQSDVPLSELLYAEPPAVLYHTPELGDAASRLRQVQLVAAKLDSRVLASWRWRLFFLRTLIDAELQRSGGRPNKTLDCYFKELAEIYYADQATPLLRPPGRSTLLDLHGGRKQAAADTDAFNPAVDEKVTVSSCFDPLLCGSGKLMDGITAETDRRNFWAGISTPQDPAQITIDLESEKTVKGIALQFRNCNDRFLFVPEWISIGVSRDGVRFSGDGSRHAVPVERAAYAPAFWNCPLNLPARFVRITLGPSQYKGNAEYRNLVELTEIKIID